MKISKNNSIKNLPMHTTMSRLKCSKNGRPIICFWGANKWTAQVHWLATWWRKCQKCNAIPAPHQKSHVYVQVACNVRRHGDTQVNESTPPPPQKKIRKKNSTGIWQQNNPADSNFGAKFDFFKKQKKWFAGLHTRLHTDTHTHCFFGFFPAGWVAPQ